MNAAFVIDCSVAMTWLFDDEATPRTKELLVRLSSESALVPAWWFIEVTNVITLAEKKKRVTPAQSTAFIADLGRLDIEVDHEAPARAFTELVPLCRAYQLTSYDAVYLEAASRRGLPLATLDAALRRAAAAFGVELL